MFQWNATLLILETRCISCLAKGLQVLRFRIWLLTFPKSIFQMVGELAPPSRTFLPQNLTAKTQQVGVCVCVWNICKDVKLPLWSPFHFTHSLYLLTYTLLWNYSLHVSYHFESSPAGSSCRRPYVLYYVTSFSDFPFSPFFQQLAGGDRVAAWLSPTKLHAVD